MKSFSRKRMLISAGCLLVIIFTVLAIQKSNGTPRHVYDGSTGTLIINGKACNNVTCKFSLDTVYKKTVTTIPTFELLAFNGTDSIAVGVMNVSDKPSWTHTIENGDSEIVVISNDPKNVSQDIVTYHHDLVTGSMVHINGQNLVNYSLSNAGGNITKTGPRSFTFSFTTHQAGKTATDYTIKGSGSY